MWIEHATLYNCWVAWNHVYSPFNIFQRCQIYAHEFSSAEELQSLKIRGICENLIFSFQLRSSPVWTDLGFIWKITGFTGWSRELLNEVFDTNSKFYIPISLQPDISSLDYLIQRNSWLEISQVYHIGFPKIGIKNQRL